MPGSRSPGRSPSSGQSKVIPIPIRVIEEVQSALHDDAPIVALESSIIVQGLPYPDNIETALAAEAEVRLAGATPCTISILEGVINLGLSTTQIEQIGSHRNALKVGCTDLARVLTTRKNGATTMAATMRCATIKGIKVVATGGIGGIHRNVSETYDISQDLLELSRLRMIVVASGAKAILDIPKTIEMLETLGVSVVAFGQDEFPAFWSRSSGINAPARVEDAMQISEMYRYQCLLEVDSGILIANPIPEESEIPIATLDPWIEEAVAAAAKSNLYGKQVTPFLLKFISECSKGETVKANKALVCSNANLAGRIATCIAGH